MQNNIQQNSIIFHKDQVLLFDKSIFLSMDLSDFLNDNILRNIPLNSFDLAVNLIEIKYIEGLNNFSNIQCMPIKEALHVIDFQQFPIFARSISIIQWDNNHQFCGKCGGKTILGMQQFERHCPSCEINYYPRISPAIIVLIHKGNEILMARSPHFPKGVYALIAGFVDAGESLEEAVHREVFEEVGIKIKNLSYNSSQPWPFPDSLMIGFNAEYESGDINIDKNELEEAGWYHYDQLPGLPSFKMSISLKMIKQFQVWRRDLHELNKN